MLIRSVNSHDNGSPTRPEPPIQSQPPPATPSYHGATPAATAGGSSNGMVRQFLPLMCNSIHRCASRMTWPRGLSDLQDWRKSLIVSVALGHVLIIGQRALTPNSQSSTSHYLLISPAGQVWGKDFLSQHLLSAIAIISYLSALARPCPCRTRNQRLPPAS